MSELCDSLTVVFTDSPKIDNHLFAKAIRWADQNPDDTIFWAREKALDKIPEIEIDWSLKTTALKRIHFGYSRNNLICKCIDEGIKSSMGSDIAAIMCSTRLPMKCSQLGSLLAALASFCHGNDGRAVVVIDLRNEERNDKELGNQQEADPFESSKFLDEDEAKENIIANKKVSEPEDKDVLLQKLKRVSTIFTKNVLIFNNDDESFTNCF